MSLVLPASVHVVSELGADGLPANWREELTTLLGYKPRRLGTLTELALYGAMRCLRAGGEERLPSGALLRVVSSRGHASSFQAAFRQSKGEPPMPFAFLQSQSSQMLAALAGALGWQGDACYLMSRSTQSIFDLALNQQTSSGMLFGYVEEEGYGQTAQSYWIRLVPTR